MINTKRRPASIGEILTEEFMTPAGLTQQMLAKLTNLAENHIDDICSNRQRLTADTALILASAFGTTSEFWLNLQRRIDVWAEAHPT